MTDTTGLVIHGNDHKNILGIFVKTDQDGDRSIYNVIDAGGGDDILRGEYDPKISKAYGSQLFGEDGNDEIMDSRGNDTLSGGAGDDLITSAYGQDVIDGGKGEDTFKAVGKVLASDGLAITGIEKLYVANSTKIGDLDLTQFAWVGGIGTLTFEHQANIHDVNFSAHASLVGTAFDDQFDVSNALAHVSIAGGGGDDVMIGSKLADHLDGEAGNDTLTGGIANDTVLGGNGDDVLNGGDGNDYVFDNNGSNTLHGGAGNDRLTATDGNNRLFGDDGDDIITLSQGDVADGGTGNDKFILGFETGHRDWSIVGGAGDDAVYAGGNTSGLAVDGVEQLYLRSAVTIDPALLDSFEGVHMAGGKVITFSHGGDFTWKRVKDEPSAFDVVKLNGSKAADHIDLSASKGLWNVDAGGGNDTVILGTASDSPTLSVNTVDGGAGNDTLTGGGSHDSLIGGDGNDVLIAGHNLVNTLIGGKGKDTFVFTEMRSQSSIADFTVIGPSHDVMDLSAVKSVHGFDDLINNHVAQYDGYIVVWFGNNDVILSGLTADDLNASDFHF
jgi:Ca2+-binding RTX toxin-like protein